MVTPASVFVMDVRQSSQFESPGALTAHLRDTVDGVVKAASIQSIPLASRHRYGDEVILVAGGFATAYLIAWYIMATWPFWAHPPYFGIAYGRTLSDLPSTADLDGWNDPLVKSARLASDVLKRQRPSVRLWLRFADGLPKPAWSADADKSHPGEIAHLATTPDGLCEVLNEYALVQDRFWKQQTHAEHAAAAVFSVEGRQDAVARALHKHPSTISRQLAKSQVDVLMTTRDRVVSLLDEYGRSEVGVNAVAFPVSCQAPHTGLERWLGRWALRQ